MSIVKRLREQRAAAVKRMRELLDRAWKESRDLTAEEQKNWDEANAAVDELADKIASAEQREQRLAEIGELEQHAEEIAAGNTPPGDEERTVEPGHRLSADERRRLEERRKEFARFLGGQDGQRSPTRDMREAAGRVWGKLAQRRSERRNLSAGVDVAAGFLYPDEIFLQQFLQEIDDMVVMRQLATVLPVSGADSLGVASLDADPDDAEWTTELDTGSEDDAMRVGRRHLHPQPLAKRIRLSRTLLRRHPAAEALVASRMAYKFSVTLEKAYLTGNGFNKPLGVFVASDDGIPTSRDVSEGNTATQIKADGLINALYSLKQAYRRSPSLRGVFHRDAIKMIRKLKDNDGQYLWLPGLSAGESETILGHRYIESEFAPNTFTSGQYVGLWGDFSNYWIADVMGYELQRLDELYAEKNQVGFIGRAESDGAPMLAEAFARIKLG